MHSSLLRLGSVLVLTIFSRARDEPTIRLGGDVSEWWSTSPTTGERSTTYHTKPQAQTWGQYAYASASSTADEVS